MISAGQLLPVLVGAALGVGGWMLGRQGGGGGSVEFLEDQLRIAEEATSALEKENQSLRSLAQGGGEVSVPQEMIAQVEKDYGLEFISSPMVHRVAGEELGYRVEAALESGLGPQGVTDRQEAYQRIGWLRPDDELLQQMVAVRSVGARAWFDEQTGEGWVTDQFELKNVPDQAAMLRLLVRILLNQNFPAQAAYPGDDAARAREALHAGAASGAEARFYAANARNIGFVPMNDNGAAARLLLTLSDFVQGVTMFPVMEGKGLADTFFVKGVEEFSERMRNAPTNTLNVVLPGEEGVGGEMDFPEITDEVYLEESGGYLGVRLWISEMGDVGMAEEVARHWVKDQYVLFADGEMSSALVWEVEFSSEAMADEFEKVARQRMAAMAGEAEAVTVGEVFEADGGRFLRVVRMNEMRVRFLNTAMRDTAEKF
ncbi:MAG: hypothetical protein ACSHX7_01225 [Luteolibacter sp.]